MAYRTLIVVITLFLQLQQETATGDEELSLGSLAGIFYILIIGLVLAMIVSFLEFCYNSKKEAQKSKVLIK